MKCESVDGYEKLKQIIRFLPDNTIATVTVGLGLFHTGLDGEKKVSELMNEYFKFEEDIHSGSIESTYRMKNSEFLRFITLMQENIKTYNYGLPEFKKVEWNIYEGLKHLGTVTATPEEINIEHKPSYDDKIHKSLSDIWNNIVPKSKTSIRIKLID